MYRNAHNHRATGASKCKPTAVVYRYGESLPV